MKKLVLGVGGLLVGGFIGFLLRPSALLVGQLPFGIVITRGSTLSGLDRLFVETAQLSFNYMMAGAILGAIGGLVIGLIAFRSRPQPAA